jgi:hypothetical protein
MIPVPGIPGAYNLTNAWDRPGTCLGIPYFGTANGAPLTVLPCDGGADQEWFMWTPPLPPHQP